MATEDNNNVPVNEEEGQDAATRDLQDSESGTVNDTDNQDAGEVEAAQQAYDASTPSFELNVDRGIADKEE